MNNKKFLVGLGHPRCGTGFTASLLQHANLKVGHERKREDGIVSWCLASEADRVPWGHSLGMLKRSFDVFCVARSPISAIPSIVPEVMRPRSYNFISKTINQVHGYEALPRASTDDFLKAALSYCYWYDLCLSFKPEIIFRVDVPDDDKALSDYVGRMVKRTNKTRRNHKPNHDKPDISTNDYRKLPLKVLTMLSDISQRLGYETDAASLRTLVVV